MKKRIPEDEFLRKRKARQRKIRRRRIIRGFVFFFIILIAVGITLSLTVLFPIETVRVSGSRIYTSEQIAHASGIKTGDNLFLASADETALKFNLPYIESVKIKRKLPGSIIITVTDAAEYACYYSGGKYYAVSKSGHVLNSYESLPDSIFEIRAPDVKCEVGKEIEFSGEKSESFISQILECSAEHGLSINYIDVTDDLALSLKTENRFTVNLGSSNYLENKFSHLAGMIKNIDSSKTGKINLSMWTTTHTEGTFIEGSAD